MTHKTSYRFLFAIVFLFFLLTIIPLLLLLLYVHPSDNDNFAIFATLKTMSSFRYTVDSFLQRGLSNRYAGAIAQRILINRIPAVITESAMHTLIIKYRMLAAIQIFCFAGSLFYLCHSFNTHIAKQGKLFLLSLFSLLFYSMVNSSSFVFHTFYEAISAGGYTTGLELIFVLIGLLIDNYHTGKKYILIAVDLFLVCGMLELFPLLAGSIILYSFIVKIISRKKVDFIFILFGIFIITIFFVQLFHPAQQDKLEMYGNGEWVVGKGEERTSPRQLLRYMKEFLQVTGDVIYTLVRKRNILFTLSLTSLAGLSLLKRDVRLPIMSIIPYYLVIALCGFSFHYCYLSIRSLERANNLISMLLSAETLLLLSAAERALVSFTLPVWKSLASLCRGLSRTKELLAFSDDLKNYFNSSRKGIILLGGTACAFILLFLVLKPENTIAECYSTVLSGSAKQYDRELTSRYKMIIESNAPVVSVPMLSEHPHVLFYIDSLESDAWASFFNKERLQFTDDQ